MARIDKASWQSISPVLDELLDASSVQRFTRLAQLHVEDPKLAEQVAALLAHQETVGAKHFLESSVVRPVGEATLAGATVGDYTLERSIGQGGMGTVWLARRSDGHYEGSVAIKFLNLALTEREGAERFRREGNALAKLAHANITHLIDAGIAAGQPYLVLEYVEGELVDHWCDARMLDVKARIRLFLQVLAAVSHAHSRLILHRDLKPSNILVTAEGRVKLLDFGLAKLLGDREPTELTRLGWHAFTPDYAAPEQAELVEATTATDIYALGVLLYVLLSGAHPTAGVTATPVERMRALIEREPMRLSDAAQNVDSAKAHARSVSPSQLARLLRGDLDNIVAKALKKSPDERYATVSALADDLERYLNDEPVSVRADSFGYRVRKFVYRHRFAVFSAATAAVMLIATSTVAVWQMVEANRQRDVAEQEQARAASTRDFLGFVLSDAGASGKPFTTLELLTRAERTIDAQYTTPEDPLAIEQLLQVGELYSSMGMQTKTLELAEAAHRRALKSGNEEMLHRADCVLGKQFHLAGKQEEAADLLDKTIAATRGQAAQASTLVECLQYRSDLELSRGNNASGLQMAREAADLATKVFRTSQAAQLPSRMQLAIAQRVAGERKLADATYRDLTDLIKRLGHERTMTGIIVANNWGKLRSDLGDLLGAAQLIESALAAGRALRPDENPDYFTSLNYAQTLLILNRLDDAERYFSLTRRVAQSEGDPDFQLLALLGLAGVERERGNFKEAGTYIETANELASQQFPAGHPSYKELLIEKGKLNLASGDFAAAVAALSEPVAQNAAAKTPKPGHVVTLAALAKAELGRGDVARAAMLAAQASKLAQELALTGESSYWVGHCLLVQSEIEAAAHRVESARKLAAQSLTQLTATVGQDHPLTRKASSLASSAA